MSYHLLFLLEYFFFREIENGVVMLEGSSLFVKFYLSVVRNGHLKCLLHGCFDIAILELLPVLWYLDHLIVYALFDLGHLIGLSVQLRLFESDLDLGDSLTLEVCIEMRIFQDLLVTVTSDVYAFDVVLEASKTGKCNLQRLHLCWVKSCSAGPETTAVAAAVKYHHLFLKKCCSP